MTYSQTFFSFLIFKPLQIQLTEAGVPGAPMAPALLLPCTVENSESGLGPVTVHGLKTEVNPVQDPPQRVSAVVPRIHVVNIYSVPLLLTNRQNKKSQKINFLNSTQSHQSDLSM